MASKGITKFQLAEFVENFTWENENYGNSTKRVSADIKFSDWFRICQKCIKQDISFMTYCRYAILRYEKDIDRMAAQIKRDGAKKSENHSRQGSLF